MPYHYDHDPLEKLFIEHGSPQFIADQVQTLLYFWRREMPAPSLEALEEEYQTMVRLKLTLRATKPIK